jgi:hypothetical protein
MTGEDHTSLSRGLPGLVRRAAFLHREFMAFDAERSFTEGSGTVTYVLDSDVLKAFADPHLYGPEEMPSWQEETRAKSREMRGQGQLLPRRSLALESVPAGLRDREDQRAMNVVRLLTQEILQKSARQPEDALFQFPAHYKETESDIKFAAETARNEVGPNRAASQPDMVEANLTRTSVLVLRAMMEQGHDRIDMRRAVMSIAENQMRRSTYGQSRAVRQNDRFSILESRYAPRKELNALTDIGVDGKFDGPIYEQGKRLLEGFLSYRQSAFRFSSTGTSIDGDAQALASLAILNKQLIDLDRNRRIVMISGSVAIVRGLYDLGPEFRHHLRQMGWQKKLPEGSSLDTWLSFFGYKPNSDDKPGHANWLHDFSFRYFRHYTGFAKVFLVDEQDQPKVDDLFNGLFAMTTNQVMTKRALVESIASSGQLRQPNVSNGESAKIYVDVLEQWDRLTARALEAAQARAADLPEKAVAAIGGRILESSISAADIEADIAEHVARQRDRSMLELSQMGARALLAQRELSVRNPPDLFFSSLSNTNRIFENLARHDVYSGEPDKFVRDYKSIDDETLGTEDNEGDDRQRSYLKFVVLGAIFSSAEKWSTALGHALRAVDVATRYAHKRPAVKVSEGSGDVPNVSGREAYYLAAVCYRMIAKSPEELKYSRDYLSKAVAKREEDIGLKPDLATRLGPQRQLSESLANSLSDYYFKRFENSDVHPDISAFLTSTEALIEAWKDQRFDGPMTLLTKVSVATNLIQVATILAYRRERNLPNEELHRDIVSQCFEFLIRPEVGRNSVVTTLVRCYRASGAAMLGRWAEAGISSKVDLSNLMEEARRKVVMKYDPWRYENLNLFLVGRFNAFWGGAPQWSNSQR